MNSFPPRNSDNLPAIPPPMSSLCNLLGMNPNNTLDIGYLQNLDVSIQVVVQGLCLMPRRSLRVRVQCMEAEAESNRKALKNNMKAASQKTSQELFDKNKDIFYTNKGLSKKN
ncbi:hypothetical protein TSUD_214980 [Trifolium subterraneum]|uniref:Uncharacterized protein n=1 Tax=Trifolium subterraneum TaxID=3900 RepID=A0A2Z6N243_TRISU|nr:hypothetical protein TSUD_214980 [Trifolium subterraneum]